MDVWVLLLPLLVYYATGSILKVDTDNAGGVQASLDDDNVGSGKEVNVLNVDKACCNGVNVPSSPTSSSQPTTTTTTTSTTTATTPAPPPHYDNPFVLVAGGHSGTSYLPTVEVISLNPEHQPVPACNRIVTGLLTGSDKAVGGSVGPDSRPFICGGSQSNGGSPALYVDSCYYLNKDPYRWDNNGVKLSSQIGLAGYSNHPTLGLVVTGGEVRGGGVTSRMETTADGNSFIISWPGVLEGLSQHCQVTVSPELIMTFGGHTGNEENINRVYEYNVTSNAWKSGPNMQQTRSSAVCGVIKNAATGEPIEVVVGGGSTNNGNAQHLDNVEILDLKTGSWRWANDTLPKAIVGAESVPFGNSFAIVGGRSSPAASAYLDTVFSYEPATESWRWINQTLTSKRYNPAAFLVNVTASLPSC